MSHLGANISLEFEDDPRVVQVRMTGALCHVTVGEAEAILRAAADHRAPGIVVDLENVDFVDSQGLRLLLTYWRRVTEQGRRFVVVRPRPPVDLVFKITLVDERLELVDDLAAALAAAGGT